MGAFLNIALWIWLSVIIVGGFVGLTVKINENPIKGIPGVVLALMLIPIMGIVFLIGGAILAFPLIYWLLF